MTRAFSLLPLLLMLVSACQSPGDDAATLATMISNHVGTLSSELTAYNNAANDVRQASAARLADGQIRAATDNAANQAQFTVWQAAGDTAILTALNALKAQSDGEMSVTESFLKQRQEAMDNLSASFGKVNYDPKKLQDVISSLQSLAGRESATTRFEISYQFASAVLKDMKQQTDAATTTLKSTPGTLDATNNAIAKTSPK